MPDFAKLVERHNGVWGGGWCMSLHARGPGWRASAALNRAENLQLVIEGRAHAALVNDGEECVGWCQFGPTSEPPRKSIKAYEADLSSRPDWSITSFLVGRTRRGRGVEAAALLGALDEIARPGGGWVESYPDNFPDEKLARVSAKTRRVAMFERRSFTRQVRSASIWVVVRKGKAGRRVEPLKSRPTAHRKLSSVSRT